MASDYYWVAAAIFVVAFLVIVSERIHKTKIALLGATLMILFPILTQDEAFHSRRFGVDYNVIFLLISMMVIVNIMSTSGVFQWAAVKAAKIGKGRPMQIMTIFVVLTAVASAFLDNVTTVLLLAPVTLLIAEELDIDPVPFLIAEILSANIGGTATLIGDPPNIIIASRAELSFLDFVVHLAPAVLVMLVGLLFALRILFGRKLQVSESKRQRIMQMDESQLIKDAALAKRSAAVLLLTIVGFLLHGALHYQPATIALGGAALLLLISKQSPRKVFSEVEWPTIFFFIGLFIMVGGIAKVGLIGDISQLVIDYTDPSPDDMFKTTMTVLWFSAGASAFVDNIPYVATMAPLIQDMANSVLHGGTADPANLPLETLHHPVLMPVWWALALGSCLGGNGTPIGASANVIVLEIAERSGIVITFLKFMAYGIPTVVLTLAVSHVYILLRYY